MSITLERRRQLDARKQVPPVPRNRPSVDIKPRQYDLTGIPTRYFNPGELPVFLHLLESVNPEVVVEFGVNNGRNPLAAFRNIASIKRYVGVDVPPGYVPPLKVQRLEVPPRAGALAAHDLRLEIIVRARGTFDLTAADLPRCDAVFIDADHSRTAVLNDYALAKRIVRPGGLIIFHDDNGMPVVEVTQTLNELVAAGANIMHVHGTWLSFEHV